MGNNVTCAINVNHGIAAISEARTYVRACVLLEMLVMSVFCYFISVHSVKRVNRSPWCLHAIVFCVP